MGKKFMGLGGTDHFWDRAKAWILNQITSAVAAKIAEVVANAPEDLDTLKEIADWIKNHANDAAAMNTQITENKNNIATNTSDISALKTSVAGKADKAHTHSTGDITSGTLPIANGGTGVTTQADINKAFIGNLEVGNDNVTDGTEFVSSYATDNGFAETTEGAVNTPYKRQFIKVWNYIKGKISSVLGLTKDNYGGKASTAGTADKVASTGSSTMWIYGRHDAICKTTSAAEGNGWKTLASIKTSSGSIEIGNLSGEDFIRIVYSSDADVNAGNNNVTQLLYIRKGNVEAPHEFIANSAKALSKMVIPIGAPSSLEDGCIWIER